MSPRDLGAVEDVIMMDAESKDGYDRVKSRGRERFDNLECGVDDRVLQVLLLDGRVVPGVGATELGELRRRVWRGGPLTFLFIVKLYCHVGFVSATTLLNRSEYNLTTFQFYIPILRVTFTFLVSGMNEIYSS